MSKKEIKIGDFVIPLKPGTMEIGDPPYQVDSIEDGLYTITQTVGTHKFTITLEEHQLRSV